MLLTNTTNRVTFNVNVIGTAATPTVRCVIGETPGLTYPAVKLADDGWEVLIDLPPSIGVGTHQFKVEVLLNGRLFTPINRNIEVGGTSETVISAPAPAPVDGPKLAPQPIIPRDEPVVTPDPASVPAEEKPKIDLLAMLNAQHKVRVDAEVTPRVELPEAPVPPAPELGSLAKIAAKPVFKKPAPSVEVKTIKISMADVANEAAKLDQPAKPKQTKRAPAVVEAKGIPVVITKGDIVYR